MGKPARDDHPEIFTALCLVLPGAGRQHRLARLRPVDGARVPGTSAANYESWGLPLAVILVVPMCLLAAVTGMAIAGLPVDIFVQIGFLVLIAMACKNAILIVESRTSKIKRA